MMHLSVILKQMIHLSVTLKQMIYQISVHLSICQLLPRTAGTVVKEQKVYINRAKSIGHNHPPIPASSPPLSILPSGTDEVHKYRNRTGAPISQFSLVVSSLVSLFCAYSPGVMALLLLSLKLLLLQLCWRLFIFTLTYMSSCSDCMGFALTLTLSPLFLCL